MERFQGFRGRSPSECYFSFWLTLELWEREACRLDSKQGKSDCTAFPNLGTSCPLIFIFRYLAQNKYEDEYEDVPKLRHAFSHAKGEISHVSKNPEQSP
jgi:hypothetical protein